jgi:cell division septum initiation protein DivIVA
MEPNEAASTSARAQELRASLSARRDVEALLAEASATREAAAADADGIIEEAQQVSDQLLRESRTEADRTTTEARQRAEGLVGRARTEAEDIARQARAAADAVRARAEAQVEDHRKRVRAELTEQVTREVAEQSRRELARVHERQQSMIGDLEASVRILGVSMEAAVANIAEMLAALDSLRAHSAESLDAATLPMSATPRHAEGADDGSEDSDTAEDEAEGDDEDSDRDRGRTPRSGHLVDVLADLDDAAGLDDEDDPPRTATEAFLRSAHLDYGDPPLPPTDDADVGARYARDAMRATARAQGRGDEEALDVVPERESGRQPGRDVQSGPDGRTQSDDSGGGGAGEAGGKPLGWLFRSSS